MVECNFRYEQTTGLFGGKKYYCCDLVSHNEEVCSEEKCIFQRILRK